MDIAYWVTLILLGGYLGSLGQSLRIVVGLKKAKRTAVELNLPLKAVLDGRLLLRSLMTGFAGGALTLLVLQDEGLNDALGRVELSSGLMMAAVVAGYVGADLFEGLLRRPPALRVTSQ